MLVCFPADTPLDKIAPRFTVSVHVKWVLASTCALRAVLFRTNSAAKNVPHFQVDAHLLLLFSNTSNCMASMEVTLSACNMIIAEKPSCCWQYRSYPALLGRRQVPFGCVGVISCHHDGYGCQHWACMIRSSLNFHDGSESMCTSLAATVLPALLHNHKLLSQLSARARTLMLFC